MKEGVTLSETCLFRICMVIPKFHVFRNSYQRYTLVIHIKDTFMYQYNNETIWRQLEILLLDEKHAIYR
jgi:hypothetical protein